MEYKWAWWVIHFGKVGDSFTVALLLSSRERPGGGCEGKVRIVEIHTSMHKHILSACRVSSQNLLPDLKETNWGNLSSRDLSFSRLGFRATE